MRDREHEHVASVGKSAIMLALAALAVTTPAGAQTAEADGSIIYARDVQHSIGEPDFPGQEHEVVTAPAGTLITTLGQSLTPLTDAENSTILASLETPGAGETALNAVMLPQDLELRSSVTMQTSRIESTIGTVIDDAMGSLDGALASIGPATGGGR